MKHIITAVALGLAVISGAALANESINDVRLAMTTLPGVASYVPAKRIDTAPVVAPIGERTLNTVTERLNRQLEQQLASELAAQAQ